MHQKCKCKTQCKTHRTRKWKKCNCKNANAQKAFRTPTWFTFTGVNVSSAQVLLPCPGYFAASICAAFGIFPFSRVAFLLSIFSTCHVASFQLALVPLVLHLSDVPLSKLYVFFPFYLHLLSLPLFKFFPLFCNCQVCLFQTCIFEFHLLAWFLHFFKM